MEYIECNFNKIINRDEGGVKFENYEILKSNHFWYLVSIIHKKGKIEADVSPMIKAGWIN